MDKRKAEFATARALAVQALGLLGFARESLRPHQDRSPRWPTGVVGTITHTADYCAVAVALERVIGSLGMDAETAGPLKDELVASICTENEIAWLQSHDTGQRGQLAKLIFSAKESFYKCQYPLTKTFLGFHDVELIFDEDRGEFRATLLRELPVHQESVATALGRYELGSELVITAMVVPSLGI